MDPVEEMQTLRTQQQVAIGRAFGETGGLLMLGGAALLAYWLLFR